MEMKRPIPTSRITRIAVVLLLLVLLSGHLSGGLLARYRVSSSGGDSARVAVFEVTEAGTFAMGGFSLTMDPRMNEDGTDGALRCATMEVHNESETSIHCTVTVESTGNLPLDFYIMNGGEKVDYVDIPVGSESPAVIDLYASWLDGQDSYLYHREMDHIIVTLTCTQID